MGGAIPFDDYNTILQSSIPSDLAINFILSRTIGSPIFEIWDALSAAIITVAAGLLFYRDYTKRKRSLDKS